MKCVISTALFKPNNRNDTARIVLMILNRWPSTNWYGLEWQVIIPSVVVSWLVLKPRPFFPNPLSPLPLDVSMKRNTSLLTSFWRRGKSFLFLYFRSLVLRRSKLAYKCILDCLEFYPPSVQHSVNLRPNDCGHFLVYSPSPLLLIVPGTSVRSSDRRRTVFSKVSTQYSIFRGECKDNTL
jgi:hypothetical protein